MAYANIAEVEVCLQDCLKYCERNPGSVYCLEFGDRLKAVIADLKSSRVSSDQHYSSWRRERGADKRSWKKVALLLREAQNELKKVDAVGYPDRRVMYWDSELLEAAARGMMKYLSAHREDIEFAADYVARFEQQIGGALTEDDDSEQAYQTYQNHIGARRDAMADATFLITDMRSAMRRDLGVDNPEYQSIRWTWALSPDEPVL